MRGGWLNSLRRLRREESGNVLYITLILVLMLASFAMVAANIIYLGVMKAKAQNAADQLALSGAALKARLLNRIANYNAVYYVARYCGWVNEIKPYLDPGSAWMAQAAMGVMYGLVAGIEIPKFSGWIHRDHWLDRIAKENGLNEQTGRFAVYPVQMGLTDPYGLLNLFGLVGVGTPELTTQVTTLNYITPTPPYLASLPCPITAIEPSYDWYMQSRVEWQTKKSVIGGKTLGIELPDIVARARADLFDQPEPSTMLLPAPVRHNWRVRLAKVDENVDREIKRRMGSQNTGQTQSGSAYMSNNAASWAGSDGILSDAEAEAMMIAQLSPLEQYHFYRDKRSRTTLTLEENVRYLEAKKQCVGIDFFEQMELNTNKMRLWASQQNQGQ